MRERGETTKPENLFTKLNYNPHIKGVLCTAAFGISAFALRILERGSYSYPLPPYLRGKLSDTMAPSVFASLSKVYGYDNFDENLVMGLSGPILFEILQGLKVINGTFDISDIPAYMVGALGWAAFEGTAKLIHDSGISLPIYRVLGIQHRKFG